MHKTKGFFITLEGCEGSGKSTHAKLLGTYLKRRGYKKILLTKEPGGNTLAKEIRKIVLNPSCHIAPLTELFLYESDRAQHINEVIQPTLKKGYIVICDRYTDSTLAYQGYGRKLDIHLIQTLNKIASQNCTPNITLYLDIPIEKGLKKARALQKESYANGDRIERETLDFHKKVRKGFLSIAQQNPRRIKKVPVYDTIEKTQHTIRNIIIAALKRHRI